VHAVIVLVVLVVFMFRIPFIDVVARGRGRVAAPQTAGPLVLAGGKDSATASVSAVSASSLRGYWGNRAAITAYHRSAIKS